jgi:Fe-S cluster assembly ATP-binding protein
MLELRNVTLRVEADKEILRDLSLRIEDNRFVVITGPNGGGKSTLAKLIAGINQPTEGRIFFDGADITDFSITERARAGIAFSFQQPVRFKGITVRDLISIAAGEPDMDEQRLCAYLYDVGLCAKDYVDREVDGSLSGGEIKRIEIATAIARHAKLSIFDEPEAGIDIWSFNNLTGVFKKMRRENNGSIVVISHQTRIFELADEIIVMADGAVSMKGSRDEILPKLLENEGKCNFLCKEQGVSDE